MPQTTWNIFEYLSGLALVGGLGWVGYSSYIENNPPVDLAGPRAAACDAMEGVGALDQSTARACLTDNDTYLVALRAAIEARAEQFHKGLNKMVADVTETADRLDGSVFEEMSADRFFGIFDPFAWDGETNQALKRTRIPLHRITVSPAFEEEDLEDLPSLTYRPESLPADEFGYSIDLDERVFEVMEFPFSFGCADIIDIDDGCRGMIFVDLRSDGVLGATPVVIGFDMEKLTKRQAIEMAYALSAPIFSDSSHSYDAARMREVAELF